MVGRIDEKYQDSSEYIYVIGADRISNDLQDVHVTANEKGPNLILDYTYNEEDDPNRYYYRSDHYNFAKNGIPAIFFFNGTHEDYHRTTDTPDKIAFSSMAERAKLIFLTTWEIANRPQRLSIDHPVE
jgi:Zn-dependent M28 family amino/carboxypeptidase